MAFWDMLSGGRSRSPDVTGAALARAAGGEAEPVFVPRGGRVLPAARGGPSLPQNTRAPSVLGAQPHTFARGREVAALLLWTLAVFFALALTSYAGEPGTSAPLDGAVPLQAAAPLQGEDWVGPVGALVARAAVNLVGVMSWVVPFECLLLGIPFVTGRRSTATASRLAGDILLVVIGASTYAEEEKLSLALRGMDPMLYAGYDILAIATDGRVKTVLQPQRQTLPWDAPLG